MYAIYLYYKPRRLMTYASYTDELFRFLANPDKVSFGSILISFLKSLGRLKYRPLLHRFLYFYYKGNSTPDELAREIEQLSKATSLVVDHITQRHRLLRKNHADTIQNNGADGYLRQDERRKGGAESGGTAMTMKYYIKGRTSAAETARAIDQAYSD